MVDRQKLITAVDKACGWMAFVSQHREESLPPCSRSGRMLHKTWKGAFKGEYTARSKEWEMFCPIWHTGQGVAALADGYLLTGKTEYLDSAKMGAEFILRERYSDPNHKHYGLIWGIEDYDDCLNTSATMECQKGLWALLKLTNDERYSQAIINQCAWIKKYAYLGGGHMYDHFCLSNDTMWEHDRQLNGAPVDGKPARAGRPLAEDAVFLKAYQISGDESFKKIFYETVDYLCENEYPEGTWAQYPPCYIKSGKVHPRHSYWWGLPMYYAYLDSGDEKYYECMKRCGEWYLKGVRRDGGHFRGTYTDFSTDSFGHETSGALCASILWEHLHKLDKDPKWHEAAARSLNFAMGVQFIEPEDKNLKGAILEKVLHPEGSDSSPYHLRDLGTIFFVQAAAAYLGEGGDNV